MVLPATVHAAFHKAAHYFGVEAGAGPGRRRLPRRRRRRPMAAVDEARDRTVLVVVSRAVVRARRRRPGHRARGRSRPRAGSAATSTRASAAGCCRTPRGSAAPCRRGRSRSRASPRSRSTCTSTATPPRAPRCCCTARRSCGGRSSSRPPTGRATRCSTRRCSRRSRAGPLAGAWAVVESLGDTGYERLTREVFEAVDAIVAGTADISGRRRAGRPPDSTLIALVTDGSLRRVHGLRRDGGAGLVRPAADVVRRPAADHPPLGERRAPAPTSTSSSPRCAESVAAAVGGRPGRGRPRRGRRSSRPSTRPRSPTPTSTGCSRPPGWSAPATTAGWPCPTGWPRSTRCSTSPSPAMREALLVAFLDRLLAAEPVRPRRARVVEPHVAARRGRQSAELLSRVSARPARPPAPACRPAPARRPGRPRSAPRARARRSASRGAAPTGGRRSAAC